MKLQKKYLIARILTFPFKLLFQMVFAVLATIAISCRWVIYGGQEVYYGEETKSSIVNLIKSNEEIIQKLNEKTK